MANEDLKSLFASIDAVLSKVDLSDVTQERASSNDLPAGYYLCELEKAELTTSKSSGNPQAALTFKVVEDGLKEAVDEDGIATLITANGTANRKVYKYYPLTVERIAQFTSDMIKFEADGTPLYTKEDFKSAEFLAEMLESLIGFRIYITASVSEKNGQKSTWYNLISNKRAAQLELPM